MTAATTKGVGVFAWIRAVASMSFSEGCKAFCLELIPLLDSKTGSSSRSIASTAERVSAAFPSVRVYRRMLRRAGLLLSGRGWRISLPGRSPGISPDPRQKSSRDLPRSQKGISPDPKGGSPQIPAPIIGTSASSSTSLSASKNTMHECAHAREEEEKDQEPRRAPIVETSPKQKRARKGKSRRALGSIHTSVRPNVLGRSPSTTPVRLGEWLETWRATKGSDCPWPAWVEAVLPYLSDDEREELLGASLSTDNPNLMHMKSIVERMCRGEASPTPRRSRPKHQKSVVPVCEDVENDPLWKGVFS